MTGAGRTTRPNRRTRRRRQRQEEEAALPVEERERRIAARRIANAERVRLAALAERRRLEE